MKRDIEGTWTVIDHMIQLRVGQTCLLIDQGMTVKDAFNTLLINARDKDLAGVDAE